METVFHHLTALPGVGRWTAEMVLIFAYLHPRILPVQDLGLKRAVQIQYGLAERPSEKMLHALARPWAPYETIATWYLWKSVDGDPSL
jgi:DNA-3-methyladenine glycosylase II